MSGFLILGLRSGTNSLVDSLYIDLQHFMDWLRRYFTYENSVLAFAFFLPIHERISTYFIFLSLFFLFFGIVRGTMVLTWDSNLTVLPIFFLAYLASVYSFSEHFDFKWIELRASFVAFPVLFLGKKALSFLLILKAFIIGCFVAYLICFGGALYSSLHLVEGSMTFEPLINPSRGFFQAIVYEGNHFFGKHFSVLVQTAYFGFYLTLAFCALMIYHQGLFKRNTVIVLAVVMTLGIVQTMSLAALGGLFILALVLSWFFLKDIRIKSMAIMALIGMFVLVSFTQPRLKILVSDLFTNHFKLDPNERYGVMLRLLSWNAAVDIIKENPLFGVGAPNAQRSLNKYYEENGYIYPLKENLNAHNQFLQIWLELGVIGALLFITVFFILLKKMVRVAKENQVFVFSFTVLLGFNFIFEVFFARYIGISIFCFFYCLSATLNEKVSNGS